MASLIHVADVLHYMYKWPGYCGGWISSPDTFLTPQTWVVFNIQLCPPRCALPKLSGCNTRAVRLRLARKLSSTDRRKLMGFRADWPHWVSAEYEIRQLLNRGFCLLWVSAACLTVLANGSLCQVRSLPRQLTLSAVIWSFGSSLNWSGWFSHSA